MKPLNRKMKYIILSLSIFVLVFGVTSVVFASTMEEIYSALKLEGLQADKQIYMPGEQPVFTYNLVNRSDTTLEIPLNTNYSQPFHLVGVRQHWVERLGPDSTIPGIPDITARDGPRYAAGGSIISTDTFLPDHLWMPSVSMPLTKTLGFNTSLFPPGEYRYYVDYRRLNPSIIQRETIDFVIASIIHVDIDIKPGIEPNNLYCQWGELVRRGIFDVAILTTESFDATLVDHTTVKFEGAREIHNDWRTGEARRHEKDVDRDGDLDLLFHFRLGDTDLECDSTEGTLIGETYDGLEIRGSDSVRMVNYNPPRPYPPPYYAAIPQAPNSTQAALTFGLLAFGCLFGAVLVIGVPSRFKNRK
jgi:hypothetical protein